MMILNLIHIICICTVANMTDAFLRRNHLCYLKNITKRNINITKTKEQFNIEEILNRSYTHM